MFISSARIACRHYAADANTYEPSTRHSPFEAISQLYGGVGVAENTGAGAYTYVPAPEWACARARSAMELMELGLTPTCQSGGFARRGWRGVGGYGRGPISRRAEVIGATGTYLLSKRA